MIEEKWAALVPDLVCEYIETSQRLYCDIIGFSVRFVRPEDKFAYLDLGGAQLMLEQLHAECWITAPLDRPFGRGMNLQIEVPEVAPIHARLRAAGLPVFEEPKEAWYRAEDIEHGQIEMLVQDPDGYLLRFVEVLEPRTLTD
ncbi:hypothetical protein ASF53_00040 [Methylobacterium sp. Leaf123]|uniref:bleomycin resistance protein n=1 Tax=Methylobacterium sp. Leaf123 TaxID=1736264 RepID=UPI0006F799E6|nr:VOC family protein [Methylobacterium sp. Leaf123]KQQ31152.1 hypothetical protein ASF53_00040 [Methylobacterium sp. Leaf123]